MVCARSLAILELGLGDGCAERHVPQRRCFDLVRLAAFEILQKRSLGDTLASLVDGGVRHRPVHAQAELSPQCLERMLVSGGQHVAQIDEVAPRDRKLSARFDCLGIATVGRGQEVFVVGQCRIAAHAEVVLHAALGGQAVVVPPIG